MPELLNLESTKAGTDTMKKTPDQIADEVARLDRVKPRIRQRSAFGDDHHDAIDAQVDVLRNNLDWDEIWSRHEDRDESDAWTESVRDAALEALAWRDGDRDVSPADDWEEMADR